MIEKLKWKPLLLLLLTITVSIFFTWPLIAEINTHIAGRPGKDALNHAWSFWWFKESIFTLKQSPILMTHIYYPEVITHPSVLATIWAKVVALLFLFF